jgi:hypothetical protein
MIEIRGSANGRKNSAPKPASKTATSLPAEDQEARNDASAPHYSVAIDGNAGFYRLFRSFSSMANFGSPATAANLHQSFRRNSRLSQSFSLLI